MSKTIGIGTLNENTRQFYEDILRSILDNRFEIKSYNFREYQDELLDVDILLISTPIMINSVRNFIPKNTKIIVMRRTFTRKAYGQLKEIPKNSRAFMVNNGADTTFETISFIYSLGFELRLFPQYPGIEPMEDIDIAITTNEEHLVPKHVRKIYNIGHMVYDMATILDLLNELDISQWERDQILYGYQEKIISAEGGVPTLFGKSITTQQQMDAILNSINDGVMEINTQGTILMANKKSQEILNTSSENIVGRKLEKIFLGEKFNIEHDKEINNQFIRYEKEDLIINSNPIYVFNRKIGHIVTLKNVTDIRRLEEQVRREITLRGYHAKYTMDNIIGESDSIKKSKNLAIKMAKSDASILIIGESGTGKELFAQAIHNESNRNTFPFIGINCAVLPENLIESELFGYEGGAFTGAKKEGKPGLFEQAHLGTLFLDEIGDLGLTMQAKLLRVLQEGEVIRVGGSKIRNVDVRVISATNKDLVRLAQEGKFRWDLYYRLNVFPLRIPALRERKEDVILIFQHFLENLHCKKRVSKDVMDILNHYIWPGNIRELQNLAIYLSELGSDPICKSDLPPNFGARLKEKQIPDLEEIDIAIMEILYSKMQDKEKIGRNKLVEYLERRNFYYTEKEIRNKLYRLQDKGYIEIGKGRQGTRLSQRGIHHIKDF